jgi:large subunit ribosomal protein L25
MEMTKIKGQRRPGGGRHANERLRRAGMLPAVIYGHKQEPELVAVPKRDIEFALQAQSHVLELSLDDAKPQPLLIKEVQYDHLYRDPIHLDLMRVDPNERVRVTIPLHFIGTPKGVSEGGELVTLITDLDVEAPVLAIPEEVRVNVADIGLGGHLYVKDLTLPAGVTPAISPDEQVCLVRTKREVAETAPAAEGEAPTGPEVIAKGKADEEGGEGAEATKK